MWKFLGRVWSCCKLLLVAWVCGFILFFIEVPQEENNNTLKADAIVVLTGAKGRIDYGISQLIAGRAPILFISGVNKEATPEEIVTQAIDKSAEAHKLYKNGRIVLGYKATSTIGNADEVQQWVHKHKYTTIRLVTSNYHMPRALLEHTSVMPDVTIIADPTIADDFGEHAWLERAWKLILGEYHRWLLANARHFIIYLGAKI